MPKEELATPTELKLRVAIKDYLKEMRRRMKEEQEMLNNRTGNYE